MIRRPVTKRRLSAPKLFSRKQPISRFHVTDLLKLSSGEIELITGYRVWLKTRHPDPAARPYYFAADAIRRAAPCRALERLTGGRVDEKITLRIAAADGEDELLGRDVAIKGADLQDAHAGGRVLRHGGIVNWKFGQRRVIVLVQHLDVNLEKGRQKLSMNKVLKKMAFPFFRICIFVAAATLIATIFVQFSTSLFSLFSFSTVSPRMLSRHEMEVTFREKRKKKKKKHRKSN